MKRILFFIVLPVLSLTSCLAFAQTEILQAPEAVSLILAILPPGAKEVILNLIFIMGSFRLLAKPICSAIFQLVDATPTKEDDRILKKILDSKWGKAVAWVLDYVASIKLRRPEAKKQ